MTLVLGYADRLSVAPGETIRFHVSVDDRTSVRADLVRLRHGDPHPDGPGFREEEVPSALSGEHPCREQRIPIGSLARVDDPAGLLDLPGSLTLAVLCWPTLPGEREQTLLGRWRAGAGYELGLDPQGRASFRVGDGTTEAAATTGAPLEERVWYLVAGLYDADAGRVAVRAVPVVASSSSRVGPVAFPAATSGESAAPVAPAGAAGFALAACEDADGRATGHFDGKLEAPRVWARALSAAELDALPGTTPAEGLVAHWDMSVGIGPEGIPSDRIADVSGNRLDAACVNLPVRGMTGAGWTGREHCYRHAPAEYAAIHFHHDDLEDAGWEPGPELTVPPDLASGVYAARFRAGGAEDHVPFCVLPPRGTATAPLLVLLPTASYMAYGNDHQGTDMGLAELVLGHTPVLTETDLVLAERRDLGMSLYDSHADGSGNCYSSRLRPLLTMRPRYLSPIANGPWGFLAELYLVDWLAAQGVPFDVATDEDLHEEGAALLGRYRCVVTGAHPEYTSHRMLDAVEEYLCAGGRLLYLGGNGFYWVTEYHPTKPHVIEVRRGIAGIRAWEGQPGEHHLATTGGLGGLWRHHGRAPQKVAGVGFAAEGLDESSHFRKTSDAGDPRGAWVFAGVTDETFGQGGLWGGGAAGLELDRYDLALGTPPDALLLAASEGHTDMYLRVSEEVPVTKPGLGGTQDPDVRADVVLFPTPNGGAVFSAPSIAWSASLSWNRYDNDVSRITRNVLDRFLAAEPLDW